MLFDQKKIAELFSTASTHTQLMSPYHLSKFEFLHGGVHEFVGGHMGNLTCAVMDPIFWFHHCYVDYLWEQFRQRQKSNIREDYPRDEEVPVFHRATDIMSPFDKTCAEGLSGKYIPKLYKYVSSPGACRTHKECGGKALWCKNGTCTACVGPDGEMSASWPNNACYFPNCDTPRNVNGVCKCAPQT